MKEILSIITKDIPETEKSARHIEGSLFLRTKEYAWLLGISQEEFYRLNRKGNLSVPVYKKGRSQRELFVKREDVNKIFEKEFIAKCERRDALKCRYRTKKD